MKYLNQFLQSQQKTLSKLTKPHTEIGFVSFVSANAESSCASSASSAPPQEPTIGASEQMHRVRILSQWVSPEELQRALNDIQPQLHLNESDRTELALSLALLDAGIDPAEVLKDVPQKQLSEIETEGPP